MSGNPQALPAVFFCFYSTPLIFSVTLWVYEYGVIGLSNVWLGFTVILLRSSHLKTWSI